MTFSSFIGSFKWDWGKYDAFETILEVGQRLIVMLPGMTWRESVESNVPKRLRCRFSESALCIPTPHPKTWRSWTLTSSRSWSAENRINRSSKVRG